jgi:uncharacterized protein
MLRLGQDFLAGRRGETYTAHTGQAWAWVAAFFVLQMFALWLAQAAALFASYAMLFGSLPDVANLTPALQAQIAKAAIVGMLPAGLVVAALCYWCAGLMNSTGDRGIPLRWPDMGSGGWIITTVGFIVFLYFVYVLIFYVLGIDPQTYAPTAEGVNDQTSMSGMVEKTMADLADEPVLFAMAFAGVVVGAPLSEELLFRGALFSALRNSWFGKSGAVVITAALWALVHGASAPWLFVCVIFIMGLALGVLLLRFGSLWVTIIVHAVWNAATTLTIFTGVGGT